METVKELLMNAEIAFANKQYEVALGWYRKVLEQTPDDISVLSRAGAICVPLQLFDEAFTYFQRAKKLDPQNGDNSFNYANACFFRKDYVGAFAAYVEAEKLGCSDDVKPRMFYQMALICSMRQDIKSALLYFEKCEQSDPSGSLSLNPDLISEKLKLYMMQKDYRNAQICAAQLVAIAPTQFRNYMIQFSLLMAIKDYATAEKVLDQTEKYAEMTDDERFTLVLQEAVFWTTRGETQGEDRSACCGRAVEILEDARAKGGLTQEQASQLALALAEAYAKAEQNEKAITILKQLLSGKTAAPAPAPVSAPAAQEMTPELLEQMAQRDMEAIQEQIDIGVLDGDMGLYAVSDYDEEGHLIHYYDPAAFGAEPVAAQEEEAAPAVSHYELPKQIREKAVFVLLTCYLAQDDFAQAQKLAANLKHSDNRYYSYYGIYTDALCERKLSGDSDVTERKYSKALAFFRSKSFSDATDTLACLFRARLYAEQGKTEKALEIAQLLGEGDRQAVLDYVEACRQ